MENPDIAPINRRFVPPDLLPDSLWAGAVRSTALTPLYLRRYAGPRHPDLRLDAHPFWELTYTFAGEGVLHTEHGDIPALPGSSTLIPPGLAHCERTERPGWDVLWIGVEGSATAAWPTAAVVTANSTSLQSWAEQAWLWSRRQPGAVGPELDGLAAFLMQAVWRLAARGDAAAVDWLERVLDYIHEHLAEDLQMADLARVADHSVGHFQRQFRAAMGETPLAYLTRIRLETAVAYLQESTHTVAHIAALCGWRDPLYFTKVCRRHFGHPPSAFRR